MPSQREPGAIGERAVCASRWCAARATADRERSGEQLAFEARQERDSMDIQRQARAMVLGRTANGARRAVWDAVEQREKVLITYPRDQIAAFKTLLEVAQR